MSDNLLDHYSSLSYPIKLSWCQEDSLFVADFVDLPGCSAYGKTAQEAYDKAQEAKEEWLRVTIEQGYPVPEPSQESEYSGRILLRMPSSLHSMLAEKAKLVGTSLNQFIVHLLSTSFVTDIVTKELASVRKEIESLRGRLESLRQPIVIYQTPSVISGNVGGWSQGYQSCSATWLTVQGEGNRDVASTGPTIAEGDQPDSFKSPKTVFSQPHSSQVM